MPLRKSHLYSSLWRSCDELRGGMDASQYKDYILTLLFMKYVSDKYAGSDDFADITVPPGGSFADMVALKGTKEIGDGINVVTGRLAEADDVMAQVIGIGPDTRQDQTVYDPTCGSWSLLIKAADAAPTNGLNPAKWMASVEARIGQQVERLAGGLSTKSRDLYQIQQAVSVDSRREGSRCA